MEKVEIYVWYNKSLLCKYNSNTIPRIGESMIIKREDYKILDVTHEVYADGQELTCINIKVYKMA